MSRKKITLFGFNLTQKQSVQIFILSILGLFISAFLLMTILSSVIMNSIHYDPYYYPKDFYIIRMIFSMLPYMFVLFGLFLLSLYSLIRCRKIAKYYSPLIDPVFKPKTNSRLTEVKPNSIAQFCPNCGNLKKGHENFCPNCGQ